MLVKRSLHGEVARGTALTAAGALLIAATYGMARFGVGLLHPVMIVERPDIAAALPSAAAGQFGSYCLAAGLAAMCVPRRSRAVAGSAGAVAGLGCLGLAFSTSAGWFIASAFVSGAGAGFASPALVGLLDAVVPEQMASTAQAGVNSGTSVGVVVAGVLATAISTPALAWAVMAAVCLATATAVVVLTSETRVLDASPPRSAGRTQTLTLPITWAFGAGVISAPAWAYGPTAVLPVAPLSRTKSAYCGRRSGWGDSQAHSSTGRSRVTVRLRPFCSARPRCWWALSRCWRRSSRAGCGRCWVPHA